ncbi:deoxyribodipyrimidine photo-lyase, partial [Marinobacterium stanieri]
MTTGLFWFTQDIRLDDNPALQQAAIQCGQLLLVYVHDSRLERAGNFNAARMGRARRDFLFEGLADLRQQLDACGQQLLVFTGDPVEVLSELVWIILCVFRVNWDPPSTAIEGLHAAARLSDG